MHPDNDDDIADLGLQPQEDSGLPGPAVTLVMLASVATILLLAAYQAAQMVAWVCRLIID
jgi:hypothetical protein